MRVSLLLLTSVLLAGCAPAPPPFHDREFVDLSYTFDADTIYWPTETGFEMTTRFAGMTDKGYYYEAHSISTPEHGGTHLDAPIHFFEGRHASDEIPIEQLVGHGVVVDVSAQCEGDRDYQVQADDFVTKRLQRARVAAAAAGDVEQPRFLRQVHDLGGELRLRLGRLLVAVVVEVEVFLAEGRFVPVHFVRALSIVSTACFAAA